MMIDKKDILAIEKYLKDEEHAREGIIAKSRLGLKESKSAIYSIHRNELLEAKARLDSASKIVSELLRMIKDYPHFKQSADMAFEEYSEAASFYGFVTENKIPSSSNLKVDPVSYLSGLSDLTGELGRRAVLEATSRRIKEVEKIRHVIDEIYGIMIKFDLRNGDLRKKADAIKWNLQKVEELLHGLNMKMH
jgi:translin